MSEMLEKILSDENIKTAYKRVYANKGAGGVDGVALQNGTLAHPQEQEENNASEEDLNAALDFLDSF